MSSKVHCYLRTLRREWGLTQEEVVSLLQRGTRNRVSLVERGLTPPNGAEILAYLVIFGSHPKTVFPAYFAEHEDRVLDSAYRLLQQLDQDSSPMVTRKRELIQGIFARAAENTNLSRS
jgi:transcriptional regulator with XRE-family HTH domain